MAVRQAINYVDVRISGEDRNRNCDDRSKRGLLHDNWWRMHDDDSGTGRNVHAVARNYVDEVRTPLSFDSSGDETTRNAADKAAC